MVRWDIWAGGCVRVWMGWRLSRDLLLALLLLWWFSPASLIVVAYALGRIRRAPAERLVDADTRQQLHKHS